MSSKESIKPFFFRKTFPADSYDCDLKGRSIFQIISHHICITYWNNILFGRHCFLSITTWLEDSMARFGDF